MNPYYTSSNPHWGQPDGPGGSSATPDGNSDRSSELDRVIEQQNAKIGTLTQTLKDARQALQEAQRAIRELSSPPLVLGVFAHPYGEDQAVILVKGERHIVKYDPAKEIKRGTEVVVNDALAITGVVSDDVLMLGEPMGITQVLHDGRLVVRSGTDSEIVVLPHYNLGSSIPEVGDRVLVNSKAGLAFELMPANTEMTEMLLEKAPDMTYSQIGGLTREVGELKDAVELPFLHRSLYKVYSLKPPKGVLLYGPPGGGKTMLAKAVANSLAKQSGHETGYFINIKGPELLSKWVGESERQIRELFALARTKAATGVPVIVFFDEIESLFPVRGSGISSDTEKTIVPQMLSVIDGVEEGLENVIIIGATNRPDLIDPALLRPGRIDIKIKIDRPDEEAAAQILGIYLNDGVPVHGSTVTALITDAVRSIYTESKDNEFLEVTYQRSDTEVLYFRDFVSGAMLRNIVDRAKQAALKAELGGARRGVTREHLLTAISTEFHENEDLPNTTNPDDWARISGRKGEKIVSVRSLVHDKSRPTGVSKVDLDTSRQYL